MTMVVVEVPKGDEAELVALSKSDASVVRSERFDAGSELIQVVLILAPPMIEGLAGIIRDRLRQGREIRIYKNGVEIIVGKEDLAEIVKKLSDEE